VASGRTADPSRPPRIRRGQPGRQLGLILGAALVVAAAGCATVPTSGAPQSLEGNSGQPQAFVQPLPPPGPQPLWTPGEVVEGFLHASASFALDPSAAERYLAPRLPWQPGSVTVVSTVEVNTPPPPRLNGGAAATVTVTVIGQRLASLNGSGQYINQPGTTNKYQFTLARYGGVWRIQVLPKVAGSNPLLLFQNDFEQVFQPRNLYFFSLKSQSQADLVPDPVFAPVQGANSALSTADLAKRLVKGLLNGAQNAPAGSWLSGATSTAFPPGTQLISVTVNNLTAVVNLGGTAAFVTQAQKDQMYAQLYETLTSSVYAPPIADSVQLEFQGQPLRVHRSQYSVPAISDQDAPLYFAAGGLIYAQAASRKPAEVAGPAQFVLSGGVTAVAASSASRPQLAIATSSAQGCMIAVGSPGSASPFSSYALGRGAGSCTSLSWDSAGDLWAVAGSRIWVLQPRHGPMQVTSPFGTSASAPTVLTMRIAPDNVRAALLVHTPGSSGHQLFLAAVSYTSTGVSLGLPDPIGTVGTNELSDPTAVNWYTPYYLAVLDGSELYQVPLTGGQAQPLGPVPSETNSISTNGAAVAVGTSAGKVSYTSGQDGSWSRPVDGAFPAYPG
jgi:hypothetical protein